MSRGLPKRCTRFLIYFLDLMRFFRHHNYMITEVQSEILRILGAAQALSRDQLVERVWAALRTVPRSEVEQAIADLQDDRRIRIACGYASVHYTLRDREAS